MQTLYKPSIKIAKPIITEFLQITAEKPLNLNDNINLTNLEIDTIFILKGA